MIDWAYVAVPILVLPIVLLFRFVGCTPFSGQTGASQTGNGNTVPTGPIQLPGPPDYRNYLMGVTPNPGTLKDPSPVSPNDIIAYWRLVNQPSSGLAADEKGIYNGNYVQVPGGILTTLVPSLINATPNDRKDSCSNFQGGYVEVPYKDGLYDGLAAGDFTIECWINAQWNQSTPIGQRTLFFAGGHYQSPSEFAAQYNVFRVYADESNHWKVDVYPNPTPIKPTPTPVILKPDISVTFGATTYLVVTLQKNALGLIDVFLWINGQKLSSSATSNTSLLDCAAPIGAPLLIGVANDSTADPQLASSTVIPTQPILSEIQEVVFYRRALTQAEITTHYELNSPTGGY